LCGPCTIDPDRVAGPIHRDFEGPALHIFVQELEPAIAAQAKPLPTGTNVERRRSWRLVQSESQSGLDIGPGDSDDMLAKNRSLLVPARVSSDHEKAAIGESL
jgi:hypothetical protein